VRRIRGRRIVHRDSEGGRLRLERVDWGEVSCPLLASVPHAQRSQFASEHVVLCWPLRIFCMKLQFWVTLLHRVRVIGKVSLTHF
jgi:hypothetical protein